MRLPFRLSLPSRDAARRLAALDHVQAIIEFAPDGTIRHANALFLEIMGYRREEIVGQHHRLFVSAEEADSEDYREHWQRLGAGEPRSGLFRRLARDGREVWLRASYVPLTDRRGRVRRIVKFAMDVTAQRQAAADMDGRLRAIDRAQGVAEFDLDGTILNANPVFLNMMGYRLEEVAGRHHRIFVEPSEAARPEYQAFWQRLRQGTYDSAVYRRLGKGGREVWIQATYNPILDASGRPVKVVKYATDITAQTVAAQTLQREVRGLSEAVLNSAARADQANEVARRAMHAAEDGSRAMQDVINTMAAIRESAQSIGGILEIIEAIAFQTNLLSLNAAVEAAQAGKAGRGFAVVAEEVRNLSRRSRAASQEIRDLIANAQQRVDEGTTLVEHTGQAMGHILASITEASRLNGSICADASTQSTGIARVNAAAAQLERVYGTA